MIKNLRKKFILINMVLISLVLITVFSSLCVSNYQKLKRDGVNAMNHILMGDPKGEPPFQMGRGRKPDKEMVNLVPVFIVNIDAKGEVSVPEQHQNVTLKDEALHEAVQRISESGRDEGKLSDLNLRYMVKETADGKKVAFADTGHESRSMRILIRNCIFMFLTAMTAFFLISLFLSGWALKPVKRAWITQKRFVADASHELKTPLTVILANMNILSSHQRDAISERIKWVENTREEANRMKALVDDLLFLAKSDEEKLPVAKTDFDLSDVVWNTLLSFETIAFEQNISIKEDIDPQILFHGNENQIKQVIVILLDNACKYADHNGSIGVRLTKEQNKILFEVNNTGIPIPKEDLEHVFERFYRASKSRARKEGGYGLGLSIAKSIVENHGGRISAVSTKEDGTTFQVKLPLG